MVERADLDGCCRRRRPSPTCRRSTHWPGGPGAILRTPRCREHIGRAILDAYAGMGEPGQWWRVRSSATAEDLPFASFAGQQDTYLGVLGAEQVLDAVRRCWASLWTDRAVAYRGTQSIDHRTARLAVVVQAMVHSETAGVLFTANPVTGRRREAVIDASPGLGEAVVSGAVTPDHLVVDTATGRMLESRVGDKGSRSAQCPVVAPSGSARPRRTGCA